MEQMGEPAEGTSPSQSEGGAVNVNTVGTSAPLERRGSRLFRSTAKLLDLPESALQAAAASVPVPEEGQLQKAGSGFTLTKKKRCYIVHIGVHRTRNCVNLLACNVRVEGTYII